MLACLEVNIGRAPRERNTVNVFVQTVIGLHAENTFDNFWGIGRLAVSRTSLFATLGSNVLGRRLTSRNQSVKLATGNLVIFLAHVGACVNIHLPLLCLIHAMEVVFATTFRRTSSTCRVPTRCFAHVREVGTSGGELICKINFELKPGCLCSNGMSCAF